MSITEVTRRNLLDALSLREGFHWHGRLNDIAFLSRIFDLENLSSSDGRYQDARGDIEQHRIRNLDWPEDWIYYDERFALLKCPDEKFLKFLAETVHPVVRSDPDEAQQLVETYNSFLRPDNYELISIGEISGRAVYGGHVLSDRNPTRQSRVFSVSRVAVTGWRHFKEVEIRIDDRLTILTGANGAGKTTILRLLSSQMGWTPRFAALPSRIGSAVRFVSSVWQKLARGSTAMGSLPIGSIQFGNAHFTEIRVPNASERESFEVSADRPVELVGVFIPSHRPIFEATMAGETQKGSSLNDHFDHYLQSIRNMWSGGDRRYNQTVGSLKAALSSSGPQFIEDFSERLKRLMPPEIGFDGLNAIHDAIFVSTTHGAFPIEASSGGLAAIIDIAWQIFASMTIFGARGVVLIDEPETHLHPRLQRSILPGLLEAFPTMQFIVATHSPLIISSVKDTLVYVLDYIDTDAGEHDNGMPRAVMSQRLDSYTKAGTADDILHSVLGVEYTMPEWAARAMATQLETVKREHYTSDAILRFEQALTQQGLQRYTALGLQRMSAETRHMDK